MLKQHILKSKMKTKKGLSEMISYILLVAITIGLSIGVYAWLKYQIPSCSESDPECFLEKDCSADTSLIINNYSCTLNTFSLSILNNGRFNISGVILAVTDKVSGIPDEYLAPIGSNALGTTFGEFIFTKPLSPGEEIEIAFSNKAKSNKKLNLINEMRMQIFRIENNKRILCKDKMIKESLNKCNLQ